MNSALDFASRYTNITDDERSIIHHAKRSVLINNKDIWCKKENSNFDITMGSYDGAESCELVGLFLLNQIQNTIEGNFGLYRDDGLGVINSSPQQIERIKKKLCALFRKHNLKITVDCNLTIVNYLDVTLDLSLERYMPYMKPNNNLLYVHNKSNHPPQVTANIPKAINRRLVNISSSKAVFDRTIPPYQEALKASGYDHKLEYHTSTSNNSKRHKRNITWYNPPYSKHVSANIGKKFIKIIDEVFTKKHPLHQIFNKNTLKISYSCMPNMKQIIQKHNRSQLQQRENNSNSRMCNCRNPDSCPLNGECLKKCIIYQATVSTNQKVETYVGLTENTFKIRFTNHKASMEHSGKRSSTELSKYIWELKDRNEQYNIKWKVLAHARAFNPSSKRCNLCLLEKYFIISKPNLASLNTRREFVTTCRHCSEYALAR